MRSGGGGRPPADRSPGPVRSRQGVDTIGPCVLHYRTEVLLTNESPQQSGHLLGWDPDHPPSQPVLILLTDCYAVYKQYGSIRTCEAPAWALARLTRGGDTRV